MKEPGASPADSDAEAGSVRPYAVSGGRRPPSAAELPLEALVRSEGGTRPGMTGEQRHAVMLASGTWLSVAELSAHLHLPIPVARVVVDHLVRAGSLQVSTPASPPHEAGDVSSRPSAPSRDVLQSVLDGIRSL